MNINKFLFPLIIFSLNLFSCNEVKLPANIQKFFDNINFDVAKKNTQTINLESSFEVNENKEITSYRYTKLKAILDENNYFYEVEEEYLGIYSVDNVKSASKKIFLNNDTSSYQMIEKFDDKINETEVSLEYVQETLTKIFYSSNNNNLKTGGLYYGDEIKQLVKFQGFMKVDEIEENLTLKIEHFLVDGVDNSYNYKINKYGMLLDYDICSFNSLKTLNGKINVVYS